MVCHAAIHYGENWNDQIEMFVLWWGSDEWTNNILIR